MREGEMMSDKKRLEQACELLREAIRRNAVTDTEREIARKWARMSLKCSNRK